MSRVGSTSKLSLEDWELLSPLSELELESVTKLDSNQLNKQHFNPTLPSSTPTPSTTISVTVKKENKAIFTKQEFHYHHLQIINQLEQSQSQIYHSHLLSLQNYIAETNIIIQAIDESRGSISELEANFKFVQENSTQLQVECERMLQDQVRLDHHQ